MSFHVTFDGLDYLTATSLDSPVKKKHFQLAPQSGLFCQSSNQTRVPSAFALLKSMRRLKMREMDQGQHLMQLVLEVVVGEGVSRCQWWLSYLTVVIIIKFKFIPFLLPSAFAVIKLS